MLSWDRGIPIAEILGNGPYQGRILRLDSDDSKSIPPDIDKQLQKLDKWELEGLKSALEKNDPKDLSDRVGFLYNEIMKDDHGLGKEIKLPSPHQIQPIPNPDGRECYYIAGPSGSGKSTYVSKYIELWREMFPDSQKHPIVLFSRVEEDECLDGFNPLRIPITDELKEDPIDLNELSDSMVIFDDVDQINNKNKLKDYVIGLRDQILEEGRHKNIYCCTTSHQMTNYKATRIPLTEASHCVFFPRCGAAHAVKYFLNKYIGLDKEQLAKIMNLPSRWICLKKTYPMLVMYEQGAYLL